ncbi:MULTISPECIES: DUF262 domain-containing protein [Vibrio]|uniref:DUF262 domain-containing protein n=1 Tax=Vibrio TaxID=662 RepID=UPI001157A180|nr:MULTISPECIES: DUF262 domain-containing protein [Vibrio]MDQ2194877.1 DUF262 domain-containing protein [Vibrio sp. A14(2019)]MDQ2198450.1 DUF262 domain-containing protein [Vibrio sp. 2017_1457_11]NNN75445.1 DUF262 domain-containing protein [Vibrio sp. B7]NNN91980.1 DUF262 domain-containing protein [Vibrio sp. B8-1]NNO07280.1 DUF262 domain-containing protein [Vibrio sp. B4-12]
MDSKFKINPKDETLTWQTIFERIKNGFELQEIESEDLDASQIIKFNDSIVIAPDYQREYRSSISDESSLIESALLEIPIPPIFLASHKLKGVQVLNVVDGQHRLRAFYRFLSGEYALQELGIIKDFNGCYIKDLPLDDQVELMSRRVSTITFRNFPGKEFELEIFNRYNKGTKPLTPQEIRHAVFDSRVNQLVNSFCNRMMSGDKDALFEAYAVSKDRFQKKTIHENIFVILSIIENGVNQTYMNDKGQVSKVMKSPQYAESYMKDKSENDSCDLAFEKTERLLDGFNEFVTTLAKITPYPFSREIYGISSKRGNKFQVSISMILAGIYKKLIESGFDFTLLENPINLETFSIEITRILNESHLEDPEYKASTTNPVEIEKTVASFDLKLV